MGDFDTIENDQGQHRWIWTSPDGAEFLGGSWHASRSAALKAGKKWVQERNTA